MKASLTDRRLYVAAALRLVVAPLIALVALLPFHLDPMGVILCAVPPAGATGMLAQRMGRDTALSAQLISVLTLMSVVTLPLFAVLAQSLSGLA